MFPFAVAEDCSSSSLPDSSGKGSISQDLLAGSLLRWHFPTLSHFIHLKILNVFAGGCLFSSIKLSAVIQSCVLSP